MNTRLTQLEAKLRAYRLSDSSSELESLITEIYDAVLDQEIYGSLWDEPILLGIKELLREDPPNEEVFGAAARFLKDRQVQVSAINDVFYKIIDTSLPLKDAVAVAAELLGIPVSQCKYLETDPALASLRLNPASPSLKIENFLRELAADSKMRELPDDIQQCISAVRNREHVGTANVRLVAQKKKIGILLPISASVRAGTGQAKLASTSEATFSDAVRRAHDDLVTRRWLSPTQDVVLSAELTEATYSGSSIALGAAMAVLLI